MINFLFRTIDFTTPIIVLYLSTTILELSQPENPYLNLAIISSSLMLILSQLRSAYPQASHNRTLTRVMELTAESWGIVIIIIITYLYLIGDSHLASRKALITWFILTPLLIVLFKLSITRIYLKKSKPTKILCIGDNIELTAFEQKRINDNNLELYCTKSLFYSKKSSGFDSIIFNYNNTPPIDEIKELTHLELSGIKIISANEFYERYLRKCHVPYNIRNIEFMNDIRKLRKTNLILKKIIDFTASIILGLLTSPILLFSVVKIKKQSPGSIFFKQKRIGFMMKPFTVIKFRSMHENSKFNPYTQEKDGRIFPYGNIMRKMRIDELPQLWNVVKGDMHFIGPRAEWTILVDNYEEKIPYYHERHLVKPGITGWAQVMYPYGANTEDARQKLMYDLYYIKHWSIWLEIETIIRTIGIVLGRKGL